MWTWTSVERYTDKQIEELVNKNVPNPKSIVKLIKKDLKGFWTDSIIIFSWIPNDEPDASWNYADYNRNIEPQDFPKIMIFDEVQKNSIESLLFGGKLYNKSYDLQILPENNWDYANLPTEEWKVEATYQIVDVVDFNRSLMVERADVRWISSTILYYGILHYDIRKWYYISPLLNDQSSTDLDIKEKIDCYKPEGDAFELWTWIYESILDIYNKCLNNTIILNYSNVDIESNINWEVTWLRLTANHSDNLISISWSSLFYYQTLWNYSDNPDECHLCDHDFLEIPYSYYWDNFYRDFDNYIFIPKVFGPEIKVKGSRF